MTNIMIRNQRKFCLRDSKKTDQSRLDGSIRIFLIRKTLCCFECTSYNQLNHNRRNLGHQTFFNFLQENV